MSITIGDFLNWSLECDHDVPKSLKKLGLQTEDLYERFKKADYLGIQMFMPELDKYFKEHPTMLKWDQYFLDESYVEDLSKGRISGEIHTQKEDIRLTHQ